MAGARGESIIQIGEREVHILFTNRALADVEAAMGRSILAVLQGMADGTTGVTETVTLLRAGMEAARRDAHEPGLAVALNTAYDVLDMAGFGPVLAAVAEAAAAVLSYGTETEAEGPNL